MIAALRKRGFTLVELLVVIAIIGILIMMLLPAINAAREAARKGTCLSNMKQLGVALAAYHEANRKLPPGIQAGNQNTTTGHIAWGNGEGGGRWSFLAYLLPQLDAANMYNSLDMIRKGPEGNPDANSNGKASNAHTLCRNTQFAVMTCPSTTSSGYRDAANHTTALTSYKGIGGTHRESLRFVSNEEGATVVTPLYPLKDSQGQPPTVQELLPIHPDGTFWPASQVRFNDMTDGASYTTVLTETVEPYFARWVYGPECIVYMLNPTPTIVFANTYSQIVGAAGQGLFWHPTKFNGHYGDDAPGYGGICRTTISCDYTIAPDQGQYQPGYEDCTASLTATDATNVKKLLCGPGSAHPAAVNFLMGDGSVKSVPKTMDPAAIMFITTRAGHDPTPDPIFK